jgi:undecaprenyl-diphosphatase
LIEFLSEIDKSLFLWLNSDQFPWLDGPMWYFSKTWFWFPVDVILLYSLFRKYDWRSAVFIVLGFALVVTIADQTASGFLKEFVQRLRPSREVDLDGLIHLVKDENGNPYIGGKFGFVSSHAANYMGIYLLYCLVMKPLKKWVLFALLAWVLLISYSRIYLGVHYPGDIVGGWIVGVIAAFIVYFILRKTRLKPLQK